MCFSLEADFFFSLQIDDFFNREAQPWEKKAVMNLPCLQTNGAKSEKSLVISPL